MNAPEPSEKRMSRLDTSPWKRYHRTAMLGVGALALVLATTGIVAARTGHPAATNAPPGSTHEARSTTRDAMILDKQAKADKSAERKVARQTARQTARQAQRQAEEASVAQSLPLVLEDGVYPAYVRGVDVANATVTLDVIQAFKHKAAMKAAVQDGEDRLDAKYLPVWIRNENDLLRTLPASQDLRIRFPGGCESGDQHVLLKSLSKATTPFDTDFYYSVTVTNGAIDRIVQHVTIAAC